MSILKKCAAALLLASTMLSLTGCNKIFGGNNSETENENAYRYEKIEETDNYLLKRGVSDYKIVLPKAATAKENLAASELTTLFAEATNVKLPTITDEGLSFNKNDKYILIGETSITEDQGFELSQENYYTSGYVIKSVGNSVFILGSTQTGTLYGTYKFLDYILDYDYYYVNVYGIDKGVADIKYCNYDVSFVPDFAYGMISYGFTNQGDAETDRYSVQRMPESPVNGGVGHASLYYLPKSIYYNENDPANYHPEWYMRPEDATDPAYEYGVPTQLCYTARGDAESYQLMVETAALALKEEMMESEDAYVFDCSMSDDHNWCRCEACSAEIEKYNADSAVVVKFLNDMTQNVEDWFKTEEGAPYKREFYVCFYAYYSLQTAPAEYVQATDSIKVADDSVYLNKHVIPVVAAIFADYTSSIYTDQNREMFLAFKAWGKLSQHVNSYLYCSRYHDYFAPLNTFNNMQELYQFCKEQNVFDMYNLGSGGEQGWSTGWCALRIYLANKLTLDVNIDMEAHTEKFFDEVYQDASKTMLAFYNEWRFVDEMNAIKFPGYVGKSSHYKNIKNSQYFPETTLDRWLGYIETALEEIEYLKTTNPELYERTYKMIVGESLWLDYFKYEIYGVSMNASEKAALAKKLAANLRYMGVTSWIEGTSIDEYLAILEG